MGGRGARLLRAAAGGRRRVSSRQPCGLGVGGIPPGTSPACVPPTAPCPPPAAATNLEWASPLRVLPYPHPLLRAPNLAVGTFDDTLRRLAEEMFEVMYE